MLKGSKEEEQTGGGKSSKIKNSMRENEGFREVSALGECNLKPG